MTDEELAEKVVALGVGDKSIPFNHETRRDHNQFYAFDKEDEDPWRDPKYFVRDWRVAGALMEKVHHIQKTTNSWDQTVIIAAPERPGKDRIYIVVEESTTRAITEACVEALS